MWLVVECYIGQVIEPTFVNYFFIVIFNKKINTFVYNFNVCCQGETRRCLVAQRHPCFERKFELTTSVVIGTDCIGSCKSNNHTITAMTAPPLLRSNIIIISTM